MPRPFLAADLSNSFVKLALSDGNSLLTEKRKLATSTVSASTLQDVTTGWSFDRVVLASVVPEKTAIFQKCFGERLNVLHHSWNLGIGIDFPEPAGIGGDRLANSAALAELYGTPGVVIDFGTAVTFDIVNSERNYVGGVIAPGLSAMTDYLHEKTALLPRIELRAPDSVVGKSTEQAMLAGAYYGYQGLVRHLIHEIRKQVGDSGNDTELKVIATGGYADLLAPGVPEIDDIQPNLTLEGVRIAGRNLLG